MNAVKANVTDKMIRDDRVEEQKEIVQPQSKVPKNMKG